MKRLLLISLYMYISIVVFAQTNITKLEYYIDKDPGYGLATDVPITPSPDVDITFNPIVSGLSGGIHRLFVRSKNANNKWSHSYCNTFYVGFGAINQNISRIEYYYDTDPGYGKATPITFTSAQDVDLNVNLDVSALQNGIHKLFIRAQDNALQWTNNQIHTFYKGIFSTGTVSNITTVEYFIDKDPGLGKGIKVPFSTGKDLDLTFNADISALTGSAHTLFIRAQDANGSWSLITYHSFCITPAKCVTPSGQTEVCKGMQNVQYTTTANAEATSYVWSILPVNAGTISGSGTIGTVKFNSGFVGEAQITVTGKNDCGLGVASDITTIKVSDCTGISNLDISNIQLFPNPSKGSFYLQFENNNTKSTVEILNISGQVVLKNTYSLQSVNDKISFDQPKGLYLVKITTENQVSTTKMIIE